MTRTTNDGDEGEQRSALKGLSTLQRRVEASRAGQVLISGLIVVVLGTGVGSNLPDSPIGRWASAVSNPIGVPTGTDIRWAMYAPDPPQRIEDIDVDVTLANNQHVIWNVQPGNKVIGAFAWVHWTNLMTRLLTSPELRPALARWVVRRVTPPTERAVHVVMTLRTENISRPGVSGSKSPATKILYQEDVAGTS